ncbi:MAG: hypothetical protein ACLPPV_13075 [Candidatus Korobacteraceae bacterium]|jgi:hypothetical protein
MDETAKWGYTAFEKWKYQQTIYNLEGQEKTWLSIGDSFYRASKCIVEGVVNGALSEDVEGRAALFLFRHYLEVTLKEIVVAGRYLTRDGNLTEDEVKEIKTGHKLGDLWKHVLEEARPKMPRDTPWETYDVDFTEKCILEFDEADANGFAFRYRNQGGERAHIDFEQFLVSMEHVSQVLEGILTVLIETRGQIIDYLHGLRLEVGW